MRCRIRLNRRFLAVAAVLIGLALNVWAQDGTRAFLIVLAAVVGCLVVVGAVGWLTGAQVVKHAHHEATAITTGNHPMTKELDQ